MSKRHADSTANISPADPNHPWVARGYRPDWVHSVRRAPVEDPYGEVAYQRAFLEAAEARSRRVPDPMLYHNSHSAREYIKRRDEAIFSVKPRGEDTKSSTQPNTPSSAGTPTYSPGQLPSQHYSSNSNMPPRRTNIKTEFEPVLSMSSSSQSSRHAQQAATNPIRPRIENHRSYTGHRPPMTLEPKLDAPSGPSRMLR